MKHALWTKVSVSKAAMAMAILSPLPLPLLLFGCADDLPRDAHGATAHIQQSGVLTVGVSEAGELAQQEKQLIEMVARRLKARVVWRKGNTHTLLQELGKQKIPLVAASVSSDTPFATHVGLSQPYLRNGPHGKDYCLAVAPGENRLLLLVDQIVAAERRRQEARQ